MSNSMPADQEPRREEVKSALEWAEYSHEPSMIPGDAWAASCVRALKRLAFAYRAREREIEHFKHQAQARDLHIERIRSKCSRIADAENKLKMRIRQLEAACILGDAAISVASAGIIKENDVIAPYLEMEARAEKAESRLALAMAVVEAVRPHSEWERGVSFSETEALRVFLAAFDAAQKDKSK